MVDQLNWAGNYKFSAVRQHTPETVEQVRELVVSCRKLKAFGARHSFNGIADTTEDHLSLARLDKIVALDRERGTVTVEAGVRYGILCEALHREGFSIHNMASLPHITVAGACATATHGSGNDNGVLATAVSAMELVTADGELITVSREQHGETFSGMVVGLGALGIVTKLTLDVGPTFMMRQDVYENLPWNHLEESFETIMGRAYSVSLFPDWKSDRINQVWLKGRVTDDENFEPETVWFDATLATRSLHPLASHPAEPCTEQGGIVGPWHERLPHFRMHYQPSSGEELQSEYMVPRQHAAAALRAVYELREEVAPLVQTSEVRTIAADGLWMSPCYQQPSVAIHFTWFRDWLAVEALLPKIEEALAPYAPRPHWGKLFTLPPVPVQALYPKLPAFRQLVEEYDPQGKFRNAFLDRYILET